jgi:hypothetical protein
VSDQHRLLHRNAFPITLHIKPLQGFFVTCTTQLFYKNQYLVITSS